MIGSLMSRMGSAEKLSVAQIQQAVKDGTLPAYIGVPLIQDKLKQQQMAQARPTQQQPPIADEIMQAANQQTRGLEMAKSNLPEEYAEGGIIGYASRGLVDDTADSLEDEELAQLYGSGSDNDFIQAIAAGGGRGEIHPSAAIQVKSEPKTRETKSGHKYHDAVVKEAERQGLDPNLALHALYKETGGLSNPESARSKAGAIGVMQLMPKTAKGLGVDPTDPMQNIQGGVGYLKQMYNKYQDPQLALMAYNAGPGRVDKALKSERGIASLPQETLAYRMAEGGSVPHFAGKESSLVDMPPEADRGNALLNDYLESINASDLAAQDKAAKVPVAPKQHMTGRGKSTSLLDALGISSAIPSGSQRTIAARRDALSTPTINNTPTQGEIDAIRATNVAPAATPISQVNNPTADDFQKFDQAAALYQAEQANKAAPTGIAQLSDSDKYRQGMEKLLFEQAAEAKKNHEMNKYLALMQAGFGMMASKSPYGIQGIGEGAQQGVGTYANLLKGEQEASKDLMSGQLGLYKYGSAAENARLNREAALAAGQGRLGEKQYEFAERQQNRNIELANNFEKVRLAQLDGRYKSMPGFGIDPKLTAAYEREKAAIYNDPRYIALMKKGYGEDYVSSSDQGTSGSKPPLSSFNK